MEMKKTILALAAFVLMAAPSFGWGREGHEAIAKIADAHLSPSAKKKIEKYLDNHSIVYWAKWMDDYRRTKEYGFTTKWHVLSVDENLAYVPDEQDGDADDERRSAKGQAGVVLDADGKGVPCVGTHRARHGAQ